MLIRYNSRESVHPFLATLSTEKQLIIQKDYPTHDLILSLSDDLRDISYTFSSLFPR